MFSTTAGKNSSSKRTMMNKLNGDVSLFTIFTFVINLLLTKTTHSIDFHFIRRLMRMWRMVLAPIIKFPFQLPWLLNFIKSYSIHFRLAYNVRTYFIFCCSDCPNVQMSITMPHRFKYFAHNADLYIFSSPKCFLAHRYRCCCCCSWRWWLLNFFFFLFHLLCCLSSFKGVRMYEIIQRMWWTVQI